MATKNDLYTKLISMKSGIEDKGGTVIVSNLNPSPDELIAGIASIENVNNQNKTITPTTSQQQISADETYTGLGVVTINAVTNEIDSDIIADNIKKDVNILGVTGTLEVIDVSDTTAVATDVLAGKDFYLANGTKAEGTIPTYAGSTTITENATLETEGKYLASDIVVNVSGGTPPISTGGLFTGATIPLTYKDNTHDYENTYEYNSANYNITITGLTGRATIIGNGTKSVSVAFDVSSATSSLAEFVISLSDGTNTYTFNGLHAHYGTTVTGVLTLAYTNIPRTGTGTIGTEYKFIESAELPSFSSSTTLRNTIYSYQLLNTLLGNYAGTSIGNYFLYTCYSFNQPLTLPSNITSIGNSFLSYCYSFNQPLTLPSEVTSIGNNFLSSCYSLSTLTYNSAVYPTDNNSLSQATNSKTSASGAGIIVYGTNRAELITALPDRTESPYRKLINGGAD